MLQKEYEIKVVGESREPEEKSTETADSFGVETIDSSESESVLEKTEIHGGEFMGKTLTTDVFKSEGMTPKYKIRIGDSVIYLPSSAYDLGRGRIAIIGYVKKDGVITARSYYRSNSQGVWRYLPDYRMGGDSDVRWYGKGYGEESITLPAMLQKALSDITSSGNLVSEPKENPNYIFAGTANQIGLGGDYYKEIDREPKKLDRKLYTDNNYGRKMRPENIVLTAEQSPDFSRLLMSWKQKTNIYGDISVEAFPSKDGKLMFMFCKDSDGRIWIGGIEDNSKIQSTGLRKSWISDVDLMTPAYEYPQQDGGYGNVLMRNGHYVDMSENYLNKIPVIREYAEYNAKRQEKS